MCSRVVNKFVVTDSPVLWMIPIFENALTMFWNDFEMDFQRISVPLKNIANVSKCNENVLQHIFNALKLHYNGKTLQRYFHYTCFSQIGSCIMCIKSLSFVITSFSIRLPHFVYMQLKPDHLKTLPKVLWTEQPHRFGVKLLKLIAWPGLPGSWRANMVNSAVFHTHLVVFNFTNLTHLKRLGMQFDKVCTEYFINLAVSS